jgi:LuxR family transcriptional regulator, maltose regulon positive regulatory protein
VNPRADYGSRVATAPLVLTKLNTPALRAGHVERAALVERLRSRAERARLVLVVAPAGWGKTTLLAEWSAAEEGTGFGWVALEPADEDPARAFAYVARALERAGAPVGDDVAAALAAPGAQGAEAALAALVNGLEGWDGRAVLVLDDLHVVREPRVLDGIGWLVEHLPPSVRIAATSRSDPKLRLGRLRARGELLEVRAADLRFGEEEAALLLADAFGLELPAELVHALADRTEGWPAALVLAALSLRDRDDPGSFIADFTGTHRYLVDYLGDEVLAGQSPERRRFLAATSILSRLRGDLCDHVTGEAGARGMLEELERENLLVVPLDAHREWFRYHHLFQDLLRQELGREHGAEHVTALHRRAAAWWDAEGEPGEAIGHLLAAGDAAEAGELVSRWWNAELQRGRLMTVLAWLERLPAETVAGDARLLLARAWLALDLGDTDGVERYAAAAETTRERGPLHEGGRSVTASTAMLRATARYQAGDVPRAASTAREAVALECDPESRWRAVGLATLGSALWWLDAADPEAEEALAEAVARAAPGRNSLAVLRALGIRAALRLEAGDEQAARRLVDEALRLRYAEHLDEYWMWSAAGSVAARLREADGDVEAAIAVAERAGAVARAGSARLEEGLALVTLAPLRATAGDVSGAAEALDAARAVLAACPDPGRLVHLVDAADRAVRARSGDRTPAAAEPLTERERAVLRLLATPMPLGEVAAALFVSRNTVKTHVRGIYRKLGAADRADAVARARRAGLL